MTRRTDVFSQSTPRDTLDLQRMYNLLSRIENGLEPLRLRFEEHVKTSGLNAVAKILGEGGVDNLVRVFSLRNAEIRK